MPPGSPPPTHTPSEPDRWSRRSRTGWEPFQTIDPSPASPTVSQAPGISASTILHLWNLEDKPGPQRKERWGQGGSTGEVAPAWGKSPSVTWNRVPFLSLSSHLCEKELPRGYCVPARCRGCDGKSGGQRSCPGVSLTSAWTSKVSPAHVSCLCRVTDPVRCTVSPVIRCAGG